MVKEMIYRLKRGTEHLNFGRDIVKDWATSYIKDIGKDEIRILDIGVGEGTDLLNIKENLPGKRFGLFGIEFYQRNIELAEKNGITVFSINIEKEVIPVEDEFFDIIIANQIIEHLKEIFWVFSEMSRVLKKGGIAIIGAPNLAALHQRVLLMFGKQPSSIELLSEHVRGFTKPCFSRFITAGGYFEILDFKGANFYPFPPPLGKVLSRLFPTFAVGIFFLIRRTEKKGEFIEVLKTSRYAAQYFGANSDK